MTGLGRAREVTHAAPRRDKVCRLEARLAGPASLSAEHEAPTMAEAIHVAAGKLERLVEHQVRTGSVAELPARP